MTEPRRDIEGPRDPESILEANIARLIRFGYRPPRPSAAFDAQLRATLRDAQLRELRRARSMAFALSAAALVIVAIGLAALVERGTGREPIAASVEGPCLYRAGAHGAWRRIEDRSSFSSGDAVALGSEDTAVIRTVTGHEIHLAPESVAERPDPSVTRASSRPRGPLLRLDRGSATVSSPTASRIDAAFVSIEGRRALYRVDIASDPPSIPVDKEFRMNRRIVIGTAAAVAVVVTIAVLSHDRDQSVTVDTPGGDRVKIESGQVGEFHSDGSSTVRDGSTVASSDPATTPDPSIPGSSDPQEFIEIPGQVLDVHGDPLPGAQLSFTRASGEAEAGRATSDDEGRFRLRVSRDATGVIVATLDRFEESRTPWPPADDPSETQGRETSEPTTEDASPAMADADVAPVEITLYTETAITGRFFVTEGGEPLDRALVGIQIYFDQYRTGQPIVRTFESEDGRFYWGGVTPGKYRVWAYRDGYARSEVAMIELGRGDIADVSLGVVPGTSLKGSIYSEATGRPIAGAIVYAHLEHLPGTVNMLNRIDCDDRVRNATRTDERGEFTLHDLRTGRALIRVLHPDYMPLDHWVELERDDEAVVDLALKQGTGFRGTAIDSRSERRSSSRVVAFSMSMRPELAQMTWSEVDENGQYHIPNLNPGSYVLVLIDIEGTDANGGQVQMAVLGATKDTIVDFIDSPSLARLKGRVIDEQGDPLAGMSVSVMTERDPADPETGRDFTMESSMSDGDGFFEIRNLKFERYSVGVSANAGGSFTVIDSIECEEAKDYEIELTFSNLSIQGTVLDVDGGAIENTEIFVLSEVGDGGSTRFSGRAMSDHAGSFTISGLGSGRHLVFARAPGYGASVSEPVKLDAETARKGKVDLILRRGATVEVEVTDRDGRAVPDLMIHVVDRGGNVVNGSLTMTTDEHGRYRYTSLAPGSHTLRIFRDGQLLHEMSFEANAAEPARVSYRLEESP
ncbi:MAG: carboxypeptidase regulatory-like domain-containing protein [Planctomycetes bacterium]|nr:carboxypeptidase regulatory-like domain-containing protein [Planctomycetota bacterium]